MMLRLLPALLFGAPAWVAIAQGAQPASCVIVMPEPADAPLVPPMLTAICNYDPPELHRRIIALVGLPNRSLTIETVERAFGLPPLRTSFDGERSARYDVVFGAAPGRGEWRLMLSFSESFHPIDARRRPRLRGNGRPALLARSGRGTIDLDIRWLQPPDVAFGSPHCLSVERLMDEARRTGWRAEIAPAMVMDAPPRTHLRLQRGRMSGQSDLTNEGGCIDDLVLIGEADPGSD
jgi:hypothetical protein